MSRYGFVGAAAVPHAPQMLSLPKSEDHAQVARVRKAMLGIGEAMRAEKPDLVIVIGNDHGDDFILRSVPAFMFHCGPRAAGRDGHAGHWAVDGEAGYELLRAMQDEGFDPAFTLDAPIGTFFTIPVEFMGWSKDTPVLPLFVNSYVPPQPSPERCFAFGQALARAVERAGRRAVLIASGGLSHYPGTAVYSEPGPDIKADTEIFERIRGGNLRHLLSMDAAALDATGNIELRSWLILAGIVGDRKPQVALLEPNWHHTYGTFGWTDLKPRKPARLWYPANPTRRAELARALHALRTDEEAGRAFLADAAAFAARWDLAEDERAALVAMDEKAMRDAMGIHALLTSGAARGLDKLRKAK
jgi:2,3-dihydroxyphenylpropionate 1,2-dioxygenase